MGQDQVSGGVSVLCWLAAPVAMFYGNLQNLVIKSKSVIKSSRIGNKFANWCNVWSIECVIVYGHVPECHVTFGRGRLHNVWWDPHIDHKTSWGDDFKRSMTYPCPRSLDESRAALRIKTFIRGASPGIPYELWDKNTIGWRGWNIATQERKVCDMEVAIVTFVVKGSAQLTVTLDRQK